MKISNEDRRARCRRRWGCGGLFHCLYRLFVKSHKNTFKTYFFTPYIYTRTHTHRDLSFIYFHAFMLIYIICGNVWKNVEMCGSVNYCKSMSYDYFFVFSTIFHNLPVFSRFCLFKIILNNICKSFIFN